jgi:ribosomal protein S18 acetylase RimI-like enzyme
MIRDATDADLAALAALNSDVQALHRAAMPERYHDTPRAQIEARFRELLADGKFRVLVADADGDVVGYAVVMRSEYPGNSFARPRQSAHVDQLGVRADARRGGHGRALMAAAEDVARAWGFATITLEVQSFNAEARGFYAALGYDAVTIKLGKKLA